MFAVCASCAVFAEVNMGEVEPVVDACVLRKRFFKYLAAAFGAVLTTSIYSFVDTVVVDGRIVVENRRIEGVDLPSLYGEVAEAVRRITTAG